LYSLKIITSVLFNAPSKYLFGQTYKNIGFLYKFARKDIMIDLEKRIIH